MSRFATLKQASNNCAFFSNKITYIRDEITALLDGVLCPVR